MSSRQFWLYRNERGLWFAGLLLLVGSLLISRAAAGDAPGWMHAQANQPLPSHDEKTDAVLLYSERVVTVQSQDRVHTLVREAYKILRPDGRAYGVVQVPYGAQEKVTYLRGWCIPAQGKDYEVKDKEAVDVAPLKVDGGNLITDLRYRLLRIPAAEPGNIVGYEYEIEEQPYVLQDIWRVQGTVPVREAHYTLQLPPGWEYKATWLNTPAVQPAQAGNQWAWIVVDVKAMRYEEHMPPITGVSAQLVLSFYPAGSATSLSFGDWRQMGTWYASLTGPQLQSSAELKEKVAALTANAPNAAAKAHAIAHFVQKDIRYVAIELGIGGWRPHPAPEVYAHRYGDCKDKVTLMNAMLREAGIESYYILINVSRGAVRPGSQAYLGAFNHAIIAIKLVGETRDAALQAVLQHPSLGKLLIFDPTRESIPLGHLGGYLQGNYGLLIGPEGGELVEMPKQELGTTGVRRTGKLTIDARGTLAGDFDELLFGDRASEQREEWRSVAQYSDHIKPLESRLSHSLGTFQLKKASVVNAEQPSMPFGYQFSVLVPNYAKTAGNLLLVRPRVIGSKSATFLETKEKRAFPVEFESLIEDTDSFEITLPPGYEVEELPPPVNLDVGFASYQSKSEFSGNILRYQRKVQFKELSVPLSKVDDLKKFYRAIASDERNNAVFRPAKRQEPAAK